ncbi:hypothetical protein ACRYCC_26445 [Actinomadura scrupuli]|uniref:hypothetical protein n=1 Tax=Actinomadura scrupuli TaxID=559629 RepID=UPI003D99D08D
MPIVPPIVRSGRAGGGAAYLLAWYELEPGQWGAEIAWMEWDGRDWRGRRAKVVAEAIEQVEGENYGSVPKYKLNQWLGLPRGER